MVRIVVVHDYLTQVGGAERVCLSLLQAPEAAEVVTSLYEPATTFPGFREQHVVTSYLDRVPFFRGDPRRAVLLLSGAFRRLHLPPHDVLICSSSGFAHHVRTDRPKLVYCHTPPRWLYESRDYARGSRATQAVATALRFQRRADAAAAASADLYIANSEHVAQRVRRVYDRECEVLWPPVSLAPEGETTPVSLPASLPSRFLLHVSRPRGYKRADVAARTFAGQSDIGLVVVGGERPETPTDSVVCLPKLTDAELRWLYQRCSGVLALSQEDFGLTPVEGHSYGKPTLALAYGGYLETVLPEENGLFVASLEESQILEGARSLLNRTWNPAAIRATAERFGEQRFRDVLVAEAEKLVANDLR